MRWDDLSTYSICAKMYKLVHNSARSWPRQKKIYILYLLLGCDRKRHNANSLYCTFNLQSTCYKRQSYNRNVSSVCDKYPHGAPKSTIKEYFEDLLIRPCLANNAHNSLCPVFNFFQRKNTYLPVWLQATSREFNREGASREALFLRATCWHGISWQELSESLWCLSLADLARACLEQLRRPLPPTL